MPPSKAPSGPGQDGSERRVDFGNSRTAAPVDATPPQQLADMLELREATQGLSLAQLEARYKGRFHDGDIKEMKHEFENMARASYYLYEPFIVIKRRCLSFFDKYHLKPF